MADEPMSTPQQPEEQAPQIWFKDLTCTGPMNTYSRLYDIVDGREVNHIVVFETAVQLDPIGGVHLHVSEGIDLTPYLDGVPFASATRRQVAAACLKWEAAEYENFQLRVRALVQSRINAVHGAQNMGVSGPGRIVRPDGSPFKTP